MIPRAVVVVAGSLVSLACVQGVAERTPSGAAPRAGDPGFRYVRELGNKVIPSGLERDHLKSPDGKMALAFTHDERLIVGRTGFYGIELVDLRSGKRHPILSLWEAHSGSGVLINVRWSADSRAVRLKGATQGFQRRDRELRGFDLLYLIDGDRFLDLSALSAPPGEQRS